MIAKSAKLRKPKRNIVFNISDKKKKCDKINEFFSRESIGDDVLMGISFTFFFSPYLSRFFKHLYVYTYYRTGGWSSRQPGLARLTKV